MAAIVSPQLHAVGESSQNTKETNVNHIPKPTYAERVAGQKSAASKAKIELCPVMVIHGEPTVEFTIEEVNSFTIEEGLHQAIILKFSYGKPDLHELRQAIPKQFNVKGYCNVGQLEYRHILVRFDLFDDFVQVLSRTTGYVTAKGEEFFYRTFPWTIGFNPREETSKAAVWISLPDLPANFFAKKSLLSIASAVGKPLALDKATQDRTRPSTARVKVLLDLLDKHPKRVRINIVDTISGRLVEHYQQIVYDNLPKFCTCCKHQGHDVKSCRWKIEKSNEEGAPIVVVEGQSKVDKLEGDARDYLNAKRAEQMVDNIEKMTVVEQQKVQTTKEDRTDNLNIDRAVNDKGHAFAINLVGQACDEQHASNAATLTDRLEVSVIEQKNANKHDVVQCSVGNTLQVTQVAVVKNSANLSDQGVHNTSHGMLENNAGGFKAPIVISDRLECANGTGILQDDTASSNSKLEATAPLNVTSDRIVVAVVTDANEIVHMRDGVGARSGGFEIVHMRDGVGAKESNPIDTAATQVLMQQQALNVKAGAHATPNVIATPSKNAAAGNDREGNANAGEGTSGATAAFQPAHARIVISNGDRPKSEMQAVQAAVQLGNSQLDSTNSKRDHDVPNTKVLVCATEREELVGSLTKSNCAIEQEELAESLVKNVGENTENGAIEHEELTGRLIKIADVTKLPEQQFEKDTRKNLDTSDGTAATKSGKIVTPGSAKQQQNTKSAGARSRALGDIVSVGDFENRELPLVESVNKSVAAGHDREGNVSQLIATTHNAGTKSNNWTVVYKSPNKKQTAGLQNQNVSSPVIGVSNCFDALVNEGENELNEVKNKEEQRRVTGSNIQQQISKNTAIFSKDIVPVDAQKTEAIQLSTETTMSSTPKLHISSPEVAKIIKQTQLNMMVNANPLILQPLVTLNTSVQEVPSQSLESYGEHVGESGQMVLSTANNANLRDMAINSKLWVNQREYDDEEDLGIGFAEDSSDEAEQCSGDEEVMSIAPKTGSPTTKLNLHAPAFFPKYSKEAGNLIHNAATTSKQIFPVDVTNENAAVPISILQQQKSNTNVLDANPADDRKAVVTLEAGQQQIVTTTPIISAAERKLLDALINTKHGNSLKVVTGSTGCETRSRDKLKNVEQPSHTATLARRQEGNTMVTQGLDHDMPNPVNIGRDIYEEGEEDAMLQQCRVDAARKGDLSPIHSGKSKKSRTRDKSWDGRVNDDANIRRPPMRNAKQKQITQATSTTSNRSKKKA